MKLLVLGSSGLLGNTITKYFFEKSSYETYGSLRNFSVLPHFKEAFHDRFIKLSDILKSNDLEIAIKRLRPEIIINCIGIDNKNKSNSIELINKYIQINSFFPHKLYEICSELGIKLIHLSTDCVFSGSTGFYCEKDNPDPIDFYGRSKLLGELNHQNNCITIRKSVIGHELQSKKGLLEWFLNQRNKVEGYKKAIFSGITVYELAKIIDKFIIPMNELNGILHVSGMPISKYDLLKIIADVYQKSIQIIPNELENIDRSLNGSNFNKLSGYKNKTWLLLIKEMFEFQSSCK